MSILSVLGLGKQAGEAISQPIDAIGNVFDKIFTSTDEKMAAEAVLEKLRQRPGELQVEINKLEAQSRSWWTSGWRPYIGWVCGTALALYYLPQFALASFLWVKFCLAQGELINYPATEISGLLELVFALLGMAGLRTLEKFGGKTK